jgi:hypothetical protein
MTNNLPEFTELAFEDSKHIYRLNGKRIPAVSTILKPLSSELYKDIDEDDLKTAADRGTSIHESAENYAKFGVEEFTESTEPYVRAFVEWWNKYNPIPIASEYRTYHPLYRYAGTADLVCLIKDKLTLVDYKSSVTFSEMLTRLQLEAYSKAIKTHGNTIEEKAVLHLQKNGSFEFIQHKPSDSEAWETFGSLLTVYNYKQKYLGGKNIG